MSGEKCSSDDIDVIIASTRNEHTGIIVEAVNNNAAVLKNVLDRLEKLERSVMKISNQYKGKSEKYADELIESEDKE